MIPNGVIGVSEVKKIDFSTLVWNCSGVVKVAKKRSERAQKLVILVLGWPNSVPRAATWVSCWAPKSYFGPNSFVYRVWASWQGRFRTRMDPGHTPDIEMMVWWGGGALLQMCEIDFSEQESIWLIFLSEVVIWSTKRFQNVVWWGAPRESFYTQNTRFCTNRDLR